MDTIEPTGKVTRYCHAVVLSTFVTHNYKCFSVDATTCRFSRMNGTIINAIDLSWYFLVCPDMLLLFSDVSRWSKFFADVNVIIYAE